MLVQSQEHRCKGSSFWTGQTFRSIFNESEVIKPNGLMVPRYPVREQQLCGTCWNIKLQDVMMLARVMVDCIG